jgi:hypothetical protein
VKRKRKEERASEKPKKKERKREKKQVELGASESPKEVKKSFNGS